MLTRRSFLSTLAAIPIVGRFVKPKPKPLVPIHGDFSIVLECEHCGEGVFHAYEGMGNFRTRKEARHAARIYAKPYRIYQWSTHQYVDPLDLIPALNRKTTETA